MASATNKSDRSKFDCSCQRRCEPEVSEVTPVHNVASLFGDSPSYTEGTWTPGHVVDNVLRDIMSMYDSGDHDIRQPRLDRIERQGEQDEDLRHNWADNFVQLSQAPIGHLSILKQGQERSRRESESKEQALLQTQLKQQQMVQRELRRQGLRDDEHDEMIRQEMDRQEEMLEQEQQRRRDSPLDMERVIPSTKAVSQLKVNCCNGTVTFGGMSSRIS